jgi:hypothetical protein
MKIARFRQPALSALAVLLISGAGIAFAAEPSAAPSGAPAVEVTEPAGAAGDTDTLQDATTPDSQADEAAEAAGSETEKAGVEEPGDENLPGGGHADDPNDANADHQFEGVE